MSVLMIDVGGMHVKVLATGHKKPVKIPSGPHMTAAKMVAAVRAATVTWTYHAVSIGYCFGRWQRGLLKKLLLVPCLGNNANAFKGGYRLWTKAYGGSTHERFVHEEKTTNQPVLAIVWAGISEPQIGGAGMIQIKRVYSESDNHDGFRILVDRVWPRGFSKERANVDEWRKELAPSTALRKWFGHDPAKWAGFRERYRKELAESGGIDALKELAQRSRDEAITLVYGAADEQHNQAVALKEFVDQLA